MSRWRLLEGFLSDAVSCEDDPQAAQNMQRWHGQLASADADPRYLEPTPKNRGAGGVLLLYTSASLAALVVAITLW